MSRPSRPDAAGGEQAPHVLRDYALIADGERGILVGPRGDFAWMCFPRWDSPAIFSSLIGGAGSYAITPRERYVWGGYYEPGTLIWHSRWLTEQATVECCQALLLPADPARAVVLRRVLAIGGTARVEVVLNPRADFGASGTRRLGLGEDGRWRARVGDAEMCWAGAPEATPLADGHGGKALRLAFELAEGEHRDLVLELAGEGTGAEAVEAEPAWEGVRAAWAARVPDLGASVAPRDCSHAYAVLSGLTSAGGGMVAAATTSLPERAGAGRSYDYRYAWIRDQCYAGQAVARAGAHALMDNAVSFVTERLLADGEKLSPAYTVGGGRVPDESHIDLPGYPGGSDIVGNWVNRQFQLDAFGEALLLFASAGAHDHLHADAWRAVEQAALAIERHWTESDRDAGIWELEPDAWTHSRLVCAAGLRAIAVHSPAGRSSAGWLALADAIVADTSSRALHPSGRWQRAPDDPRVDASLLLAAVRGAVPAGDPRSLATLEAVERELTEDGYCYRYKPDERPLGAAEGAFLLCGFWLALARQQQGDRVAAARCFERGRTACGPPGLLSEEFDVNQRQLRGNLPQAFVHALLLEAAVVQDAQAE